MYSFRRYSRSSTDRDDLNCHLSVLTASRAVDTNSVDPATNWDFYESLKGDECREIVDPPGGGGGEEETGMKRLIA